MQTKYGVNVSIFFGTIPQTHLTVAHAHAEHRVEYSGFGDKIFFHVHIAHMLSRLRSVLDYLGAYGTSSRYFADKFYTSVGDVLIAVNPFKETNAFTLEVIPTASIGCPCTVCET